MKLWLLKPIVLEGREDPWKPWYDKTFGMLIRAETETAARKLATSKADDEARYMLDVWERSEYASCIELCNEGPVGLIIKDLMSA